MIAVRFWQVVSTLFLKLFKMTLFYPADTTVAGADSYQLLQQKIVFDVFRYIAAALTSGESW